MYGELILATTMFWKWWYLPIFLFLVPMVTSLFVIYHSAFDDLASVVLIPPAYLVFWAAAIFIIIGHFI